MPSPKIFISHRQDDAKIATVVSKHLREWGVADDAIFQSSDPQRGLTVGEEVKSQLEKMLEEINLLILLYTYLEEDWSYSMWECGIAQGKSTVKTRTVVLQCTEDEPTVFRNELRIRVSPREIRRFAEDFHNKVDFFPSNEGEDETAFAGNTSAEVITSRSERLFSELSATIPSGSATSKHLWDFVRLHLNSKVAQAISNLDDEEKIRGMIRGNLELRRPKFVGIGNSVDTAVRQFGYGSFQPGLKLSDLITKWAKNDTTSQTAWADELYEAIFRAVTNSQSTAASSRFKSVREDVEWWFLPAVTRMRGLRDHSLEFDVYLIRVPEADRKVAPRKKATRKKAPKRTAKNPPRKTKSREEGGSSS